MNKLEGMPVPNVINLREAKDRADHMRSEFERLGVTEIRIHQYERFENTDIEYIGHAGLISKMMMDGIPTIKGIVSSHFLTIKWWYENTDEEVGIFFEDDLDFSTVQHWNFNFKEFIEKFDSNWGALQLSIVHEGIPRMVPRKRQMEDHGMQCYMLTRKYAGKLVKYYFNQNSDKVIHYRMPLCARPSPENNILWGFGRVFIFPIFNHNVPKFETLSKTKNSFSNVSLNSYNFIHTWWENQGRKLSLDEIFNN